MALKENIKNLAVKIQDGLEIDKKTGVVTEKVVGKTYADNLPEGVTMDTVNSISSYNTEYIAAGAYAVGNMAIDAMTSSKKLEKVTGELRMAEKDKAAYTVDRSKTTINQLSENKEEVTKYAATRVSYEVHGTGNSTGQLKTVRDLLSEAAEKAFGK